MFKLKPPTTFEKKLSLLESRGMRLILDRDAALLALQNENYYRLSGYTFHIFLEIRRTFAYTISKRRKNTIRCNQ